MNKYKFITDEFLIKKSRIYTYMRSVIDHLIHILKIYNFY